MRILLAPDSFKGSLSAIEVSQAMAKGATDFDPGMECILVPIADGGEGTLEALSLATACELITCPSHDPLGRTIKAQYGINRKDNTAIIEMAKASGLPLLSPEEYNPLLASTFGTGELIKHALDQGIRKFIIAIGGSATNDGGAGMAQALGAKLLGKQGYEIKVSGGQLHLLDRINMSDFDTRIAESHFQVACDVTNPLCGPNGAAYVYGPQKGASSKEVEILDQNLNHYADILNRDLGMDVKNLPGSGAAGGLGAGLMAFCGAELKSGFQLIAEACHLEKIVKKADLIITGEGSLDRQSLSGKAPYDVAQLGQKYDKPVFGIAGILGDGHESLLAHGFTQLFSINPSGMPIEYSIKNAPALIRDVVKRILSLHSQ